MRSVQINSSYFHDFTWSFNASSARRASFGLSMAIIFRRASTRENTHLILIQPNQLFIECTKLSFVYNVDGFDQSETFVQSP